MCKMNGKKRRALKKGSASNHVLGEIAHTVTNQTSWETELCFPPLFVRVLEHLRARVPCLQPTQHHRLALIRLDVRLEREGEVGEGVPLQCLDAENLGRSQGDTFLLASSHNHIRD